MDTQGVTVSEICGSKAVCTGAVSLRPPTHVSDSSKLNLSSVLWCNLNIQVLDGDYAVVPFHTVSSSLPPPLFSQGLSWWWGYGLFCSALDFDLFALQLAVLVIINGDKVSLKFVSLGFFCYYYLHRLFHSCFLFVVFFLFYLLNFECLRILCHVLSVLCKWINTQVNK